MKSHSVLTRRVFRAIIANRPYHSATCSLRTTSASQHASIQSRPTVVRSAQRRNLFGFTVALPRVELAGAKGSSQNIDAALGKLSECVDAKANRARPPPTQDLVDALRFLFEVRRQTDRGLVPNEVYLVSAALQHLLAEESSSAETLSTDDPKQLQTRDLFDLLYVLSRPNARHGLHRNDIQELAKTAYDVLVKIDPEKPDLQRYFITALANSGAAEKALELLLAQPNDRHPEAWSAVLQGLVQEEHADTMWSVLDKAGFESSDLGTIRSRLLQLFCERNDTDGANRTWKLAQSQGAIDNAALEALVHACIRNNQVDLLRLAVERLEDSLINSRDSSSSNNIAGTVLTAFAAQGQPIPAIEAKMQSLLNAGIQLNIHEMNQLIKYAYSQQDPQSADAYIQVAQNIGAIADAETYALRLDYDLSNNDLSAAREAFESLSIQDIPENHTEIPALNRYLTALASQPTPDSQLISRIMDRITETSGELSTDALSALTSLYLARDDIESADSLLHYRIDDLPTSSRAQISSIFTTFITNPATPAQRAFNAYELFRQAFPETPPLARLPLMQSFFTRNRSDLACLVFGHMRQRKDTPSARPDDSCYAACFYGIASCRDVDGLQMIYNMLKLDHLVTPTTKIHNAMMAAYTACQTPFTAIIDHYWKILDSREGPTLSTFILALRACEVWTGAGGEEARRIMALLQKWEVPITKEIYDAYIGALAGQAQFENCVELIECMETDIGVRPDAITLGTFYNAIPWQYRKDEVEGWARRRYPGLWEELVEGVGERVDEEWDVRYFDVDRSVEVDDVLLFGQEGKGYGILPGEAKRLRLEGPGSRNG